MLQDGKNMKEPLLTLSHTTPWRVVLCCRWFEDEEIDVDMDITTELQQQVVYQVQEARAGVLHHMDPTAANVCYTSIAAHQKCVCAHYCARILCLIGFVWSTDFAVQYCVISGLFTLV